MKMSNLIFRAPMTLMAEDGDGEMFDIASTPIHAKEINHVIVRDPFWSDNQVEFVLDRDELETTPIASVRFGATYEDHQMWSSAYVRTTRPLTEDEELSLIKGITGQWSDGWGESFEQVEINGSPPYRTYYASFWNNKNWKIKKVADFEYP